MGGAVKSVFKPITSILMPDIEKPDEPTVDQDTVERNAEQERQAKNERKKRSAGQRGFRSLLSNGQTGFSLGDGGTL